MKTPVAICLSLLGITGLFTAGYLIERHITSNVERDLLLNSGRREFANIQNFANQLAVCEGLEKQVSGIERSVKLCSDLYDLVHSEPYHTFLNEPYIHPYTLYVTLLHVYMSMY